jgi:palmitoyltransferase
MPFSASSLSIPAVLCLICFLSFPSQYLLHGLGPRPLDRSESIFFNCNIALLLVSYWRSIRADPGRVPLEKDAEEPADTPDGRLLAAKRRWCRVCVGPKPPRAHHCKVCKR